MAVYCPSELHLVKTKDPVVFMLPLAYAYNNNNNNNNACRDDHQALWIDKNRSLWVR